MTSKLGVKDIQADEAADLIERYGKRIQDEVTALQARLEKEIIWEGKGRLGYNQMQREIDDAVNDFGTAVLGAADWIRGTKETVHAADNTVERMFIG